MHPTSQGWVRYQRCVCGEWQVSVISGADRTEQVTPVSRIRTSSTPD